MARSRSPHLLSTNHQAALDWGPPNHLVTKRCQCASRSVLVVTASKPRHSQVLIDRGFRRRSQACAALRGMQGRAVTRGAQTVAMLYPRLSQGMPLQPGTVRKEIILGTPAACAMQRRGGLMPEPPPSSMPPRSSQLGLREQDVLVDAGVVLDKLQLLGQLARVLASHAAGGGGAGARQTFVTPASNRHPSIYPEGAFSNPTY